LAGIPPQVNERAKDVLAQLEADHRDALDRPTIQSPGTGTGGGNYQLTLFGFADHPLLEELQKLDINSMTPVDAMKFLQEAKQKLQQPASS
jgi:DNA mismatch repair protein MutS